MERKDLISKIYEVVDKSFNEFKNQIIKNDSYCEEMALMYNFKKYLQYIGEDNKDFSDRELEYIIKIGLDNFMDIFMEIFWNSDFGNSYMDIKAIIKESIKEL